LNGLNAKTLTDPTQLTECRNFFSTYTDVNLLLSYVALQNWAGAYDDTLHNWFVYERLVDRRLVWAPWDADDLYGQFGSNVTSIFQGQQGFSSGIYNNNVMKNAFIGCFKADLVQRYKLLHQTVLSAANTGALLDKIIAQVDENDFAADFGEHPASPQQVSLRVFV
jgi:hypothetical protein